MLKVYEQITGMKKEATKREAQKKEMADVIEQERLTEVKGKLRGHGRHQGFQLMGNRTPPIRSQECFPTTSSRRKEDGW
jgi:hypothetical protein